MYDNTTVQMSTASLSLADKARLEEIAKLTAKGYEPEQIRHVTDLDVVYIRRIQARQEFEDALRAFSPEAAKLWEESQRSSQARKRVKIAAREDAPEHYQMARDIVRNSGSLSDKDKVGYLIKLLEFSGAVDETVEEEVISLAPSQLSLIQETLRELNERPLAAGIGEGNGAVRETGGYVTTPSNTRVS